MTLPKKYGTLLDLVLVGSGLKRNMGIEARADVFAKLFEEGFDG
jgi:hypothetical protein